MSFGLIGLYNPCERDSGIDQKEGEDGINGGGQAGMMQIGSNGRAKQRPDRGGAKRSCCQQERG